MKAYVFPGQGAQFVGMGKDLYENNPLAKEMFEKANEILGFRITDLMFAGTDEDLRQTKVTQPAIFLHSVILAKTLGDQFKPDMTAGHSLGEFCCSRSLVFRRRTCSGIQTCYGDAESLRSHPLDNGCRSGIAGRKSRRDLRKHRR